MLSIPPDLDRALAMTVLTHLRIAGAGPNVAPSAELRTIVASVVEALRTQGARASDIALAFEDAFAALAAGHGDPRQRRRVRQLEREAWQAAATRLGYGGPVSGG